MTFDLDVLVRENIKNLKPYSSARKEFAAPAEVYLDANENSFGSPLEKNYHRYPDPLQLRIKEIVGGWYDLTPEQIFVGNGSDEAIDLLLRVFCRPGVDRALICPPTYGMYEVSAAINDVQIERVLLDENFELQPEKVLENINAQTKLIFLCSPNNPTGNVLNRNAIIEILRNFLGIVVVDEAYIHFSGQPSFVKELTSFPNLVVMQTFSKAWGLAGLRVGMAFAGVEIIDLLNRIKSPYNVSEIAQEAVLSALQNAQQAQEKIKQIIEQRERLAAELNQLPFVQGVYPSEANFLLVKTVDANQVYQRLIEQKIVVRNRSYVELCEDCLRVTVGTPIENERLIRELREFV